MSAAAQSAGDDAQQIARAEPPRFEAFGERHEIARAERALELRERAERETQLIGLAVERRLDLSAFPIGHDCLTPREGERAGRFERDVESHSRRCARRDNRGS